MVDLPKLQLDESFTRKRKCVDQIAQKETKRPQHTTNSTKGKGRSNTFEKWLNSNKSDAGENSIRPTGASKTLPAEIPLPGNTPMDELHVLSMDNNMNASGENVRPQSPTTQTDLEVEIFQQSEIWRPQFGSPSNLLTTSSSPFTVVSDSLDLARGIITCKDRVHINKKSVTVRYKEMILNIMKAAMLGISLEDEFKRIQQMEPALKAKEDLIKTLKSEKISMEEKHKDSENSLTTLLHQIKEELKDQKNRTDSAETLLKSQKVLYDEALQKIRYFETHNTELLNKASSRGHTLAQKQQAIETMSKKVEEQRCLTDSIDEKIRQLNSKLKAEIEGAVNIAVNNAAAEYTKQINMKIKEYWELGYDAAVFDSNTIKVPENENTFANPIAVECPNISPSPSHADAVNLDDQNNGNQVFSEVQHNCSNDIIGSNDLAAVSENAAVLIPTSSRQDQLAECSENIEKM